MQGLVGVCGAKIIGLAVRVSGRGVGRVSSICLWHERTRRGAVRVMTYRLDYNILHMVA